MRQPPHIVLDFPGTDGRLQRRVFVAPARVVIAERPEDVQPALCVVNEAVSAGCHAVGYVSYEAAPAFDPAFRVRPGSSMPLLWFGVFGESGVAQLETEGGDFVLGTWRPDTREEEYSDEIDRIRAAIAAGETYQTNFTFRLRAPFSGDALALYEQLRIAHEQSFCAFLNLGRFRIVSLSPELFFRFADGELVARPMKGTRPRGRYPAEDAERAAELLASEKDRAENLMIVDLVRNDLGRIAVVGSVHVPSLFALERYPTVWQMTSTITARPTPGLSFADVFAALFPCGSVTGAPKIATMGMIADLERTPREVYCGAIGLLTPDEGAVFSVAIRTLVIDSERGEACYGVGGGVTWDSTSAGEYAEALVKAAVLSTPTPSFRLLETMRLQDGVLVRRRRHLQRIAESAGYFGFPHPREAVDRALDDAALAHVRGQWRVRLLVDRSGEVEVECAPLEALGEPPLAVAFAAEPVDSRDPFLFHKTTNRTEYERRRESRPDCFDLLLRNERGELTELSIGNLVIALDGELCTPPQACGLLAGVLRGELLERGVIRERVVRLADMPRNTGLWLVNSVREWVPIRLVD
jgi:para-aminobenzoate synthetase / 4-amino-4-deoxychorismate lyase